MTKTEVIKIELEEGNETIELQLTEDKKILELTATFDVLDINRKELHNLIKWLKVFEDRML